MLGLVTPPLVTIGAPGYIDITTGLSDSRLLANFLVLWLVITSRVKSLYWWNIVLATLAI